MGRSRTTTPAPSIITHSHKPCFTLSTQLEHGLAPSLLRQQLIEDLLDQREQQRQQRDYKKKRGVLQDEEEEGLPGIGELRESVPCIEEREIDPLVRDALPPGELLETLNSYSLSLLSPFLVPPLTPSTPLLPKEYLDATLQPFTTRLESHEKTTAMGSTESKGWKSTRERWRMHDWVNNNPRHPSKRDSGSEDEEADEEEGEEGSEMDEFEEKTQGRNGVWVDVEERFDGSALLALGLLVNLMIRSGLQSPLSIQNPTKKTLGLIGTSEAAKLARREYHRDYARQRRLKRKAEGLTVNGTVPVAERGSKRRRKVEKIERRRKRVVGEEEGDSTSMAVTPIQTTDEAIDVEADPSVAEVGDDTQVQNDPEEGLDSVQIGGRSMRKRRKTTGFERHPADAFLR